MSSEQVIAGLARACDEWETEAAMRGGNAGRLALRRCAETVREYLKLADRLSTPAAGGDAAPVQVVKRYRPILRPPQQPNAQPTARLRGDPAGEWVRYDDYRQLQARNAEQAAKIAELAAERDQWFGRAASMFGYVPGEVRCGDLREMADRMERAAKSEAKLTALLDGIEGLEAKFRAVGDGSTFTSISMAIAADDLKALREKAK